MKGRFTTNHDKGSRGHAIDREPTSPGWKLEVRPPLVSGPTSFFAGPSLSTEFNQNLGTPAQLDVSLEKATQADTVTVTEDEI